MKAGYKPIIYSSQADIDAGKVNGMVGVDVIVVDTNGIPTGTIYQGATGAPSTIATAASVQTAVSAIVINDWIANTAVALNEVKKATVAIGAIRIGDLIRSISAHTTGATFDSTEAALWTDTDINLVTSVAGRTGAVVLAESDIANLTTDLGLKVDKITGKGLSTNDYTTAEQTKLSGIATGATAITVENVLTSTNTATALSAAQGKTLQDGKAPIASPTFTGTVGGITATMVGLGNVTNTSDANKPVSTAQQTALNLKVDISTNTTDMAAKQATLVSGTNIKTVNGTSVLGSGDVASTTTITNITSPVLTGSTVVSALVILATTDWDKQIPVDATSGNISVQLPTAVGNSGKSIRVVRIDSSVNIVTVYARYDEGIGGIHAGADAIGLKATGMITVKSNGAQPVLAAWENPASVSRLWMPSDLTGQVGWYKPDALAAGSLATWTDSFGLNNVTASATVPTVATGGQNGYNKVGFNGANSYFSAASINLDTITVFGLCVFNAPAYHNIIAGNNTNGFSLGTGNTSPYKLSAGQRGVTSFASSTTGHAQGTPALYGNTYDSAGFCVYYKDGATDGSLTDNRAMATQPIQLGGNTNMDWYEQIVYTTVQVAADIDKLSGYLAHKYALTANLAGGHTYKTVPPVISLATY